MASMLMAKAIYVLQTQKEIAHLNHRVLHSLYIYLRIQTTHFSVIHKHSDVITLYYPSFCSNNIIHSAHTMFT